MIAYLGVDNGVSGGLALIGGDSGNLICWFPMPVQKTRKGNEVNIKYADDWLDEFSMNPDNTVVVIEEPGGSKSAKAATSMAGSFHALRALFTLRGFRMHRITPPQWQKPLLKCKTGDTKPAALTMARQLWPKEKWLETERCSKPHEGGVDAALIAEWARREKL